MRPARFEKIAVAPRPATLLNFHRCLVRQKYQALFSPRRRRKPGPKGPSDALIDAIVELKRRNPGFGCPRIALIVARTFGIEVDKDVVRRVLARHHRPFPGDGGPSWLTFFGHAKDSPWSVDLFRCESIALRTHWVLVVMDQYTRRIAGIGVHAGEVDGMALCRMFNHAIVRQAKPRYLSSDNDPLFEYQRWQANLRILDIESVKTVPCAPWSHPFVERVISTVRRELLDRTLFWNVRDLERKLLAFRYYYNRERVHSGIGATTPEEAGGARSRVVADIGNYRWQPHCHGLYQFPAAA